jgi:hypothetical protein
MAEVQVTLDDSSVAVLKGVDKIHRDSIINVGLALVSKTGYYKTLSGKQDSDDLDDTASLEVQGQESDKDTSSKKKETSKSKPKSTSWDAF